MADIYDSWGNTISIQNGNGQELTGPNDIANLNPFRYRGYYLDSETGLYYLHNRYYDPQTCRFLNADTTDILEAKGDLYDKNLFAYCDNNPVARVDYGGEFWDTVLDVISLTISVSEVINNPTSGTAWAGLAADIVCTAVPGLTGGGIAVKAVTKADNVVDAAKAVYKAADKASDIRKATGSYEIMYKSGKNYVGKGGYKRAINSAQRNARRYFDEVTSISWKRAPNARAAFMDEYIMQKKRGVLSSNRNAMTYNKIWSPGRKYYFLKFKRY